MNTSKINPGDVYFIDVWSCINLCLSGDTPKLCIMLLMRSDDLTSPISIIRIRENLFLYDVRYE